MIPRVGPGGTSFQGAGLYYLHDKDALTSDRVAFTHTLNTHTDSADRSLKVMAWTAMHQSELKQAAGVKATGRKLEKPVYTYSLAWAQDETPTGHRDDRDAPACELVQRFEEVLRGSSPSGQLGDKNSINLAGLREGHHLVAGVTVGLGTGDRFFVNVQHVVPGAGGKIGRFCPTAPPFPGSTA